MRATYWDLVTMTTPTTPVSHIAEIERVRSREDLNRGAEERWDYDSLDKKQNKTKNIISLILMWKLLFEEFSICFWMQSGAIARVCAVIYVKGHPPRWP